MFSTRFGIEIEFTGITRLQAAKAAKEYLHGSITDNSSNRYRVTAADRRGWTFTYDGSINTQRKANRQTVRASSDYSVELVSPILTYREDIETLQGLVRALHKAGAFTNNSCGIHIHLDGDGHNVRSIRNFVNLIASRNDLFYKALQIAPNRMRYCKKMDEYLVTEMNRLKPSSLSQIEDIWYSQYPGNRSMHYHQSRYHFLNLHSFFHGHHTVELRGFNGTLHAGKIRAYIVFSLAMNHQALSLLIGGSKMARKRYYVAYGSNLNQRQMAQRCPTAQVIGPAVLHGWALRFRGRTGAVATLEQSKGSTVPVLVWSIQPKDEEALDRYEGWPFLYRKEKLRVYVGDRRVRAMIYIMNEAGRPYGAPGKSYYHTIREGYETAGFDTAILDNGVKESIMATRERVVKFSPQKQDFKK